MEVALLNETLNLPINTRYISEDSNTQQKVLEYKQLSTKRKQNTTKF